jgi:TetR/AcrR family transcriptional regulator, transcriptional repressor for nem operon
MTIVIIGVRTRIVEDADMKVSAATAAANRRRITKHAARMFRQRGLAGVGVDALTKAAGLSHGSLYSRFGSRDRLVQEAVAEAFAGFAGGIGGEPGLESFVERYLSAEHRDDPGAGCVVAALGCEIPHQSRKVRHAFTEGVKKSIARMGTRLAERDARRAGEDAALTATATMIGAMVLARAVDDRALSDRILRASRAHVLGKS